jgi:hypothetical protein
VLTLVLGFILGSIEKVSGLTLLTHEGGVVVRDEFEVSYSTIAHLEYVITIPAVI